MNQQQHYILELRAEPGNWTAPVEVRLRGALKSLLRAWGLRCVAARPMQDTFPASQAGDNTEPKTLSLAQPAGSLQYTIQTP